MAPKLAPARAESCRDHMRETPALWGFLFLRTELPPSTAEKLSNTFLSGDILWRGVRVAGHFPGATAKPPTRVVEDVEGHPISTV